MFQYTKFFKGLRQGLTDDYFREDRAWKRLSRVPSTVHRGFSVTISCLRKEGNTISNTMYDKAPDWSCTLLEEEDVYHLAFNL